MIFLGVAIAGALGAVTRAVVDAIVSPRVQSRVPIATIFINISGSFILGVLTGLVLYHGEPTSMRTVLGTGFCGGYTTFSTFAWETVVLTESRLQRAAAINLVATVVFSVAAAAIGLGLAGL
jgi:CrcB protein